MSNWLSTRFREGADHDPTFLSESAISINCGDGMNIGWGELVVILAIVLLIVGARRLPEIGRSLGQAVREFQEALRRKR